MESPGIISDEKNYSGWLAGGWKTYAALELVVPAGEEVPLAEPDMLMEALVKVFPPEVLLPPVVMLLEALASCSSVNGDDSRSGGVGCSLEDGKVRRADVDSAQISGDRFIRSQYGRLTP